MTFEQMEALATGEALAHFVHGQREELVSAVREVAAIEAIFKEQGLSVSKEAMEAEYAAAVTQFHQQVGCWNAVPSVWEINTHIHK